VIIAIWVYLVSQEDRFRYGEGGIGLIVLGVTSLIGLGISGLIGRRMVNRTGLGAAVAVPAVSALLLAGSCFGILGGFSG
jgi:hypothetical protein